MSKFAVCVLFSKDDKFLSVSRKDKPELIGLPGGKVDEGETVTQAAIRETFEEIGFTPEEKFLIPVFSAFSNGYFTITYLYCDDEVDFSKFDSPEGLSVNFVSKYDLCHVEKCPFADYNMALFSTCQVRI